MEDAQFIVLELGQTAYRKSKSDYQFPFGRVKQKTRFFIHTFTCDCIIAILI